MTNTTQTQTFQINEDFREFVNTEVLPLTDLNQDSFWEQMTQLIADLAPVNAELLAKRDTIQAKLDAWHEDNKGTPIDSETYTQFLRDIGYLLPEGDNFSIETDNVDAEISTTAGPQLVVPLKNARFALNAANARWGSLYDALYGSDIIPKTNGLKPGKTFNPARGKRVIEMAKDFLDENFPLAEGSHRDATGYLIYFENLMATFPDGSQTGLRCQSKFVGTHGSHSDPESILLKNNGLHVELCINRKGAIGSNDLTGMDDILVEAALTTIMDCEDSVAAVDAQDKIETYRNWIGLTEGDLQVSFQKGDQTVYRKLQKDRQFTMKNGESLTLPGRSLMLIRNVGIHMYTDLITDGQGNELPEGIIDAVITSMIAMQDLKADRSLRNSREGSIYIVKPKMHGPEEVAFSNELFGRVEEILGLPANTLKMGIMDEERRTSINLKECIRQAKNRVVFINTGFLDRTGDEIHTSMKAGAFLPKGEIKGAQWLGAYERNNVDVGLECGLSGRAQIGKGMWAMPDEMNRMLEEKIGHPTAGANTAWVPSPTAAVIHAMHYHKVDVFAIQEEMSQRPRVNREDMLAIPLMPSDRKLTAEEIQAELENNVQGILGYVVPWIDQGTGCSKIPDIHNVGLMEDRATLRISSQHIANWLEHGICDAETVEKIMVSMAAIVDEQNAGKPDYRPMMPEPHKSTAFKAAHALIFNGATEANGYTEATLHKFRREAKRLDSEMESQTINNTETKEAS